MTTSKIIKGKLNIVEWSKKFKSTIEFFRVNLYISASYTGLSIIDGDRNLIELGTVQETRKRFFPQNSRLRVSKEVVSFPSIHLNSVVDL